MVDVAKWLESLGLEILAQRFADNDIDMDLLRELTEEDLKDLGVASLGQRRKLLRAIEQLRDTAPQPAPTKEVPLAQHQAAPERRQLTLMFCDIVGSTELASKLALEDMRELLRSYQDICVRSIREFDGFVAKFMGDGVLAYFGYPVAHEDDAARAVYASLSLVAALRKSTTQGTMPLSVRVGIATGMVVVGDLIGEGGAQEETVIGETPNLAARLQTLADPNSIVISAQTRQLLASQFDVQSLGAHELKGFADPVPAWKIIGENANISRFDAAHTESLSPLVGRAQEAALLLDRWRLAAQGNGQVVLLSGEAGIGKSRVAQELREQIRDEASIVVRYQCSPHHSNQPFYPAIDQIWHAAEFASDEPADHRLAKLEAMVDRSGLVRAEAIPLLTLLLSIPGSDKYEVLDLPPSVIKERTIGVLISLLAGLAHTAPVLFLLEDAHWIDPTTLELATRALDQLESLRVLSLITYRPGFAAPWVGRPNVTALALSRLARPQVIAMIGDVAGGKLLPSDVVDQIVAKTDGVPLFVEELTKTVLGSGLVREEPDGYVLAKALTPLAIPATIQDSLMARLDRLAPVKEIAQVGAVIGREFTYRLLEAVVGGTPLAIQNGLEQLVTAGLLFARGSASEPSFVFKHALVQDTAYASLLRSRREQIHGDIARALSERFKDQADAAPEILAHHFTEAGLISPALANWVAAAEVALARSANVEGARYAETGLALLAKLEEGREREQLELALLLARANALLALKCYTALETVEVLGQVKRLLDAGLGTDMQRFSILYGLWAANYVAGRVGVAQELAAQYLIVAERVSDPTYSMIAHRIVGAALIASGHHPEGLAHLIEALANYDPVRHRPLSYRFGQDIGLSALCHQVWALWFAGEIDEANRLGAQILSELSAHGHATTVAFCMLYGGVFPALFARAFETVERLGRELTEYCESRRMGANYASAGRLCSAVANAIRNPATANIPAIRAEEAILHGYGVYILESPINALIAELLIAVGDPDSAEAVLQQAIRFVEDTKESYWLAELHRLQGICAERRGQSAASVERYFGQAAEVARRQQALPLEMRALSDLCEFRQRHHGTDLPTAELEQLLSAMKGNTCPDAERARAILAR